MSGDPSRSVGSAAPAFVAELSTALGNKPVMELRVWLMLAQRREEALMSAHEPWRDLVAGAREGEPAILLLSRVLASIWTHEASHTVLLTRWREALERAPDAAAFTGELEGFIMVQCMAAGRLSTFTSWLKSAMVGAFDSVAPSGTLAERLLSYEATERASEAGYARILELLGILGSARIEAELGSPFHTLLLTMVTDELPRLIAEERFHGDLFAELHAWLTPDGRSFVRELREDFIVKRLRVLAGRHSMLGDGSLIGNMGLTEVLRE